MGPVAQGIQNQRLHSTYQLIAGVRDTVAIGEISESSDAVSHHFECAMPQRHWLKLEPEESERAVDFDQIELGLTAAQLALFEHIGKGAAQRLESLRRPITGDGRLLPEVEDPHVIEAEDVVGVGMSEDHSIDSWQTETKGLSPQISRSIDKNDSVLDLDLEPGPPPFVARTGRGAHGAVATDHRYTGGGATAEHGDAERHRGSLPIGLTCAKSAGKIGWGAWRTPRSPSREGLSACGALPGEARPGRSASPSPRTGS